MATTAAATAPATAPTADARVPFDPTGKVMWARNRIDLTETAPYFRAVQGGVYHKDGVIHGILLDDFGGPRTHFDAEVVITRLAGSRQHGTNPRTLATMLKTAQKNMDDEHPVALILGSGSKCEIKLAEKCKYAVMGLFWVTDLWVQNSLDNGRHVLYCHVRLEKVDLASKSWWAPSSPDPPQLHERDFKMKVATTKCETCDVTMTKRYTEAWVCANQNCASFSQPAGAAPDIPLTFDNDYIAQRKPAPEQQKSAIDLAPRTFDTKTSLRELWRGRCCENCFRAVPRVHWDRWECPDCGLRKEAHPGMPADTAFEGNPQKGWKKKPLVLNDDVHIVSRDIRIRNRSFNLHRIELPDGIGDLLLFHPIPTTPNQPDFIRDLRQSLITDANQGVVQLSRCNFKKGSLGLMSRHFLQNFGEEYNYKNAMGTTPFETAPAIIKELRDITREVESSAPETQATRPANELLLVGYWKDQSMDWHTDGEDEVGSPITTFSLGCPARMEWAWNKYWYAHEDKNGAAKPGDPMPGSLRYDAIQDLKNQNLTADEYERRRIDIIKSKVGRPGDSSDPPPYIIAHLFEGSFVIMRGTEIAKRIKHAVRPVGEMRFAATFRRLNPVRKATTDEEAATDQEATTPGRKTRSQSGGTPETQTTPDRKTRSQSKGIPVKKTTPDRKSTPDRKASFGRKTTPEKKVSSSERQTPPKKRSSSRRRTTPEKSSSPERQTTPGAKTTPKKATQEKGQRNKSESPQSMATSRKRKRDDDDSSADDGGPSKKRVLRSAQK